MVFITGVSPDYTSLVTLDVTTQRDIDFIKRHWGIAEHEADGDYLFFHAVNRRDGHGDYDVELGTKQYMARRDVKSWTESYSILHSSKYYNRLYPGSDAVLHGDFFRPLGPVCATDEVHQMAPIHREDGRPCMRPFYVIDETSSIIMPYTGRGEVTVDCFNVVLTSIGNASDGTQRAMVMVDGPSDRRTVQHRLLVDITNRPRSAEGGSANYVAFLNKRVEHIESFLQSTFGPR